MEIIRAKLLGFCMGVRRAVESVEQSLEQYSSSDKKIYTLGPLIHNPQVMENFEKRGVKVLKEEDVDSLDKNSVVVIRAHGTTVSTQKKLEQIQCMVLDSTCPRVRVSQKKVEEFYRNGYQIILAGDRNHGEVVSICSYADNNAIVIENSQEAEELTLSGKCYLLAQTTFSMTEFKKISDVLNSKTEQLEIFNSICTATKERQNALKELEGKSDGILVVGGKNSANTRRLYEKAKEISPHACLIEDESEIPEEFFKMKTVAITAGASTPDFIIEKVENSLKK